MGKLTLILGGARSGKSAFAQRLATGYGSHILYVATAEAGDEEMAQRIREHQKARPASWRTLEEPLAVPEALRQSVAGADAVVLDSITLWVSNLLLKGDTAEAETAVREVEGAVDELLGYIVEGGAPFVVVSDEVGQGLIPANALGRLFRDLLGAINQKLAARADRVYYLVAGLALLLKPAARPGGMEAPTGPQE